MSTIWEQMMDSYSMNSIAFKTAFYFNTFIKTYGFIKKSQWWSQEQLEAYQLQQLNRLLNHAYNNVPYYRRIFNERGLKPESIKDFEDLQKLPFLTKDMVLENINDLKARNYPGYKFESTMTGGSSGFPLRFYTERGVWLARLFAYNKIMLEWADCRLIDKSVYFDGYNEAWKHQIFGRILALSSFYMTDENLPIYIEKIRKFKPKYIVAYPSAPLVLANYMNKNNIDSFPSIKSIISFGETLYDWHRDLLENTFKCKVYNQYGHREQSVIAATCEKSNYFHVFPQYGIVELIDKDGKPVTKEGEIGEIVATGFHTFIFPFIRLKTGDVAVHTTQKCDCGRNFSLLKNVEGRLQDFLVSKTKRIVPLIQVHHLVGSTSMNVKESQLYQDTEGEVVLNIVKTKDYTERDTINIKNRFQKILGNDFNITFCFVDHIPRTRRGKYQFLIQKLPIEFGPTLNSQL